MSHSIEQIVQFSFPTQIHYGLGARKQVTAELQRSHLNRPLIVTDRGVAELSELKNFVGDLESSGIQPHVFSEIWGNPVKSQVEAGVVSYKDANCDSIIGFGGGAALDVCKVIALMVNHPGDLFDYDGSAGNPRPIDQEIPMIFALPTTAGTGSEVGRASVVSDDKTHQKKVLFHPKFLPSHVFVDPELTLNLPANITAATGMDALTHLVEAFLAKGYHPMADGIALEGVRLVAESLVPVYEMAKNPPEDKTEYLNLRGQMMNAAYMGAVAFQKGLGVTHSIAHALSTVNDLHHGLANAILIDHCMEYNAKAVPEKFVQLSLAVGLDATPESFLMWLRKLKTQLDIPSHLVEAGVQAEHVEEIVKLALQDGCHADNPCPVSEEDFRSIVNQALG